jgi:3-phenylpropionate/cinnamic acid dioxygenase small subunit
MAFVTDIIFLNTHGRFKDKVYRVINGRTVSSRYPVYEKGRKRSEKQVANNVTFGDAAIYAKRVIIDPTLRYKYEERVKGLQNAWNLAIKDYMLRHRVKKIKGIDTSGYEELIRRSVNLSTWERDKEPTATRSNNEATIKNVESSVTDEVLFWGG